VHRNKPPFACCADVAGFDHLRATFCKKGEYSSSNIYSISEIMISGALLFCSLAAHPKMLLLRLSVPKLLPGRSL
jgi:hypothetical protein